MNPRLIFRSFCHGTWGSAGSSPCLVTSALAMELEASTFSPGWSSELHQAASEGRAGDLQRLLQAGHSPMARGGVGWWVRGAYQGHRTPLHYAAKQGHLSCIRLLLCHGADPNAKDEDGYTPLHYLSQCHAPRPEWAEPLKLGTNSLLGYGAEPRTRTKGGHTPLMLATTHGNTACQTALEEHSMCTCTPLIP